MAVNWAELDENNIVLRVTVGNSEEPDEGYQWLIDNLGGNWVKTYPTGLIDKNFPGVGYTYDEVKKIFIPPKPEDFIDENGQSFTFVLNEETCLWDPIESEV